MGRVGNIFLEWHCPIAGRGDTRQTSTRFTDEMANAPARRRVTGLALGLVDMLFETPVLSAEDIRTRFGVSHPAAMTALRLFRFRFLARDDRQDRYRRYVAEAIFEIVL